jgi:thymidylate kinase
VVWVKGRKKGKNLVVSIEGIHGVGKTTVLDLLRQKYAGDSSWGFFNERKQQRDFISFGSKDPQMAFRSEVYFIQQMTIRNTEIARKIAGGDGKICVMDRSAISVLVYSAALNMQQNDFQQLMDMYESVEWHEDYLIYLAATPETLLNRIRHRGSLDALRLEWNEEDLAYINRLVEKYEQYFIRFKYGNRMARIDTTNLTPSEVAKIVESLIRKKTGIDGGNATLDSHVQKSLDRWVTTSS